MIKGVLPALFLFAVQEGNCQASKAPLPLLSPDSFFSDSGVGFDGHYNRCVWVCCSRRIKSGDTIRVVKFCGGMIGACPASWTLQHENGEGWYLERNRSYRYRRRSSVQVLFEEASLKIHYRGRVYQFMPLKDEGAHFKYFRILKDLSHTSG